VAKAQGQSEMSERFKVNEIDDAVRAFGPEKGMELIEKLQEWFAGMDMRYTDVDGVQITGVDFHFRVDGEYLKVERKVKGQA
jgi:hypothetical protein